MMKCYFGGCVVPADYSYVAVCFAESHKDAKRILWSGSSTLVEECDYRYVDMRVRRHKEYDHLVAEHNIVKPGMVTDTKLQRAMGWYCDGDAMCMSCGLHEMDGLFPVCDECHCCDDCGHDDDCPTNQKTNYLDRFK